MAFIYVIRLVEIRKQTRKEKSTESFILLLLPFTPIVHSKKQLGSNSKIYIYIYMLEGKIYCTEVNIPLILFITPSSKPVLQYKIFVGSLFKEDEAAEAILFLEP